MSKKEFIKRVAVMRAPFINFRIDPSIPYLNCYCVIKEAHVFKNKFIAGSTRMMRREYLAGETDRYYERESKMKAKFTKWLGGEKQNVIV